MAFDGKVPIVGPETPVAMATDTNLELSALFTRSARLLTAVAGTNTLTAQSTPVLTSYADGMLFGFVPVNDNVNAVTLNIDTAGDKDLKHGNGTALGSGEIRSGTFYIAIFHAAADEFRLLDSSSVIQPTIQLSTSSGIWTKPAGLSYAEIICIGQGTAGFYNPFLDLEGGGGGAAALITVAANSLGATEIVTVPVVGAGLPTSFGAHCIADDGGVRPAGGLASNSTGDLLFDGGRGGVGFGGPSGRYYGPGGTGNVAGSLYGGGGGGSANGHLTGSGSTTFPAGGKGVCIVKEFY